MTQIGCWVIAAAHTQMNHNSMHSWDILGGHFWGIKHGEESVRNISDKNNKTYKETLAPIN